MIARIWRGYTTPPNAGTYEGMLKPDLLPGLSRQKGFRGSFLLRRERGNEVEFVTMILWDSLDDLRALTGPDYETAIIPAERKAVLSRWDEKAAHYEMCAARLWVTADREGR
jgi:antibiotic biosynthesis monooxygenase (ABM) superfamily enzyme